MPFIGERTRLFDGSHRFFCLSRCWLRRYPRSPRKRRIPPLPRRWSPFRSPALRGSSPSRSPPATGLQPGTSVSRQDIQAGADKLAKLGAFASVQYRYSTLGAGIKLEYQVTDAPEIPASFDNFPWFTDEELIAGIKSSIPLFDGMVPLQGAMLDQICSSIQKLPTPRACTFTCRMRSPSAALETSRCSFSAPRAIN